MRTTRNIVGPRNIGSGVSWGLPGLPDAPGASWAAQGFSGAPRGLLGPPGALRGLLGHFGASWGVLGPDIRTPLPRSLKSIVNVVFVL